ncbi:MAG: SH3 domain-containing protein [Devosia sp.]
MLLPKRSSGRQFRAILSALFASLLTVTPVALEAAEGPSGLPLPRFVTTRSDPINVRVGPGTRYDIAWVYVKAGTPVEIIQEFDTWRKIRDSDGSEGWLHQNLLVGNRSGYVAPWLQPTERIALLVGADDGSSVRAWLTPNFKVDIKECDGTWCKVIAQSKPVTGNPQNFEGWLRQDQLWGVYKGETFD